MHTKIIQVTCLLCLVISLNAQDLCKKGANRLESRAGFANPVSTTFDHLTKQGTMYNLTEFACNVNFDSPLNLAYTINQQSDLIYFESYFDTTHTSIKEQGYYRLVYVDEETGYCWHKDLVWNTLDGTGHLIKKEYYNNGKLILPKAMPQPTINR